MAFDPVERTRAYHAALNACVAEKVEAFFARSARYVSPGVNGVVEGRSAIIAAFAAYFAEYPDQHAVDDNLVALGPLTARSEWRLTATARSTGKRIARRGVATVEYDAEGQIIHVEIEDR